MLVAEVAYDGGKEEKAVHAQDTTTLTPRYIPEQPYIIQDDPTRIRLYSDRLTPRQPQFRVALRRPNLVSTTRWARTQRS